MIRLPSSLCLQVFLGKTRPSNAKRLVSRTHRFSLHGCSFNFTLTTRMKHSILCVDDESDNVDALERLFRRKYRVFKATSGDQALEILAENPVSVIISDQRMPQMTGVELLAESIKTHPRSIRILLTGYTDIDSVISAINNGHVYRYVTKPWDPVDLSNAVDKAIELFELTAELVEKNHALELALSELRTLDQAKNQFMILVNHELKTPLTSMMSFVDLLSETKLDSDQALYLSRVRTSTLRLQDMVTDALEFVLAETKQMKTDPRRLEVSSLFLMNSIPEKVRELAQSRMVDFSFNLAPATVMADEKSTRNVFRRLIHNAAKFADSDTVINIEGQVVDEYYHLSISNHGRPIEEKHLSQMLKPYTLNENSMNHSVGTGMGLSICQALLKLQNSSLHLTCQKNLIAAQFALNLAEA